jgi:hypothetical protein
MTMTMMMMIWLACLLSCSRPREESGHEAPGDDERRMPPPACLWPCCVHARSRSCGHDSRARACVQAALDAAYHKDEVARRRAAEAEAEADVAREARGRAEAAAQLAEDEARRAKAPSASPSPRSRCQCRRRRIDSPIGSAARAEGLAAASRAPIPC